MSRVLTKGNRAGPEDSHADWDEQENLKNNNIAFYDLLDLETRNHEYSYPWFDFDDAVYFPDRDDVVQFLFGGNDLVIRLPESEEVMLPGENRDGEEEWYDCGLFAWLPFYVKLNDEEDGGDLIEINEGFESWDPCLTDGFNWSVVIQGVGQRAWYKSPPYPDPRPRPVKSGESQQLVQRPETLASPNPSDSGPLINQEVIAIENVDRPIASKVALIAENEGGDMIQSEGSAYLIPPHPSNQFNDFVQNILQNVFGIDVESAPEWVSEYPIVGEEQLREEVKNLEEQLSEIESEVEKAKWYRQLLFANDDDTKYELEEPVREAFREVGLNVDGEKSRFRDGGIQLNDRTFVLEITGRSGGVSVEKIQKLERHVNDAEKEDYGDNLIGLLIYNPYRNEDPKSRHLNTQNFVNALEKRNFRLIVTHQVYEMVSQYKRGETDTDDIVAKLKEDETIIKFSDSVKKDGSRLQNRIKSVQYRLTDLFR